MTVSKLNITPATNSDLERILEIQKKAFLSEGILYNNLNIQPLNQSLNEIVDECKDKKVLKATLEQIIVGSVRANEFNNCCWVNKLVVLPEFQQQGIGGKLLGEIEKYFPHVEKFILATGAKSVANIRLYEKIGYIIVGEEIFHDGVQAVVMEKINKSEN